MVISGGQFRPDALKPKEVVSLLLDDAEMESKFLQRQAEQEQMRKKRRKKPAGSHQVN
jgi:DNA helicase INO80